MKKRRNNPRALEEERAGETDEQSSNAQKKEPYEQIDEISADEQPVHEEHEVDLPRKRIFPPVSASAQVRKYNLVF
jgi:hypothetical protein